MDNRKGVCDNRIWQMTPAQISRGWVRRMNDDDELLKIQDVMRILKVSRPQIYRLLSTSIPTVLLGGSRRLTRVRRGDLNAWLERYNHRPLEQSQPEERAEAMA